MEDPSKASLVHGVCSTGNENHHKNENLTTYCLTVNYVPFRYAIDDAIGEAEAEITNSSSPNIYLLLDAQKSYAIKQCVAVVSVKNMLKWGFIESLHESARFSIAPCYGSHKDATVQSLTVYAIFLLKLKQESNITTPLSGNRCNYQYKTKP